MCTDHYQGTVERGKELLVSAPIEGSSLDVGMHILNTVPRLPFRGSDGPAAQSLNLMRPGDPKLSHSEVVSKDK